MKKSALIALAALAPLALAACGSSTDASEDAVADTVEMPADEAMAGTPPPVADPSAQVEVAESAVDSAASAVPTASGAAPAASPTPAATPAAPAAE